MGLTIRFSPESEETFEILKEQLLVRWGEAFVDKLKAKVTKSLNAISKSSYMYAIADEERGVRKCVLHGNCSMFYKVTEQQILI